MCNNIKIYMQKIWSQQIKINIMTITWVKEVGEQDNVVHSKIYKIYIQNSTTFEHLVKFLKNIWSVQYQLQ